MGVFVWVVPGLSVKSVMEIRNGEVRFNCPKCVELHGSPDTKKHLYVNLEKGVFHCFRCGWSGRIPELPSEILELVLPLFSASHSVSSEAKKFYYSSKPLDSHEQILEFLTGRLGFPRELIEARLFPLYARAVEIKGEVWAEFSSRNQYGEKDYFVLRSLRDKVYKNPPFEKPLFKVGVFESGSSGLDTAVVVEGPLDAFATYLRTGLPSFALLGKTLSSKQLSELYSLKPKMIIVALDGDAKKEGVRVAKKLNSFSEVLVSLLPKGKDPASLSGEVVEYLVKYTPYLEVIVDKLAELEGGG